MGCHDIVRGSFFAFDRLWPYNESVMPDADWGIPWGQRKRTKKEKKFWV